jgi:N-methylhydantoinase B
VLTDDPATCSVFCDRTVVPAQGFFGGEPGARGELLINGTAPANPKAEQLIQPGDLIELLMPGGGGYGPPAEREPALRERDRIEGYVAS